jgi:hypothetical protein
LPAYHHASFVFATLAFEETLPIISASDLDAVIPLWNAIDSAIKRLVDLGQMDGAFYVEEVSIIGFLPLRLQPHVHGIFQVPHGSFNACASLQEQFTRSLRNLVLSPSVKVVPLTSEESFANRLSYTTKAVDLVSTYRSALIGNESRNLRARLQMNRELRTFLHGWTQLTHGRHTIRRRGTMHHASAHYIGNDWTPTQRWEYVHQFNAELMERRRTLLDAA